MKNTKHQIPDSRFKILRSGFTLMKRTSVREVGFTLIELLVVISVIGILATLISANLNAARTRARDSERKSDLRNIQVALRLYFNDRGGYPTGDASGNILGCGTAGTSTCVWGEPWSVGSTIYMQTLPADPVTDQNYTYELGTDLDSYTLTACLENGSDTGGVANADCSSGLAFQIKE